jgi:hypothetical protein
MTKEELLKPRYKVIADYPGRWKEFEIGGIITIDKLLNAELIGKLIYPSREKLKDSLLYNKPCWISENEMKIYGEGFFKLYPHLFKKLEWWEERKPEELPHYVIDKEIPTVKYKVYGWLQNNAMFQFSDSEMAITHTQFFVPATKEEYEQLLNSVKNDEPSVASKAASSNSAK